LFLNYLDGGAQFHGHKREKTKAGLAELAGLERWQRG